MSNKKNMYHILNTSEIETDNYNSFTGDDTDSSDDDIISDVNEYQFYSQRDRIAKGIKSFQNIPDIQNMSSSPSSHMKDRGYRKFSKIKKIIKIEKKKRINQKKLLCKNNTFSGYCNYGNRCSFAHSLNEQSLEDYRRVTIDFITSDSDISNVNLDDKLNSVLKDELIIFTRPCDKCLEGKCTGGYNCRFGACKREYIICYEDLHYGNCVDINCKKIHLTKRGLKPILKKIYYTLGSSSSIRSAIGKSENIHNNHNNQSSRFVYPDNKLILDSLINIYSQRNKTNTFRPNIGEDDNYNFDSSSDEECEHSIFIDKLDIFIKEDLIFDNEKTEITSQR